MKILHFGPEGFDTYVFSLLNGFRNLGHEVETCNIVFMKDFENKARKSIEEFNPDMVLTIGGWHAHFDAKLLWKIIKEYGLPNVYWAIEDPTFFDWSSTIHVDAYDFIFTVSEECVEKYAKLGKPAAYLSYACNPEFHKRVEAVEEYKNDIVLLSNKVKEYEAERCAFRNKCYVDLVEPVVKGGYDIKLYGYGWDDEKLAIPTKNLGGYVPRTDVPKVYSSAKIVLIIQWDYTGHICFKTYEALGCRCMQIAPYTPLQEKYFTHGEHLVYSRSAEETVKLVDYYLSHEEERELIAARGQEEAYKNHNCTLRARKALEVLKGHGFNIDFVEKEGGMIL